MAHRPAIPKDIEDNLLVSCQHRCCICGEFGVQIHHIDGDPTNNDESNLIPLCGTCSQKVHITFPPAARTHGISEDQLKIYKKNWIEKCSARSPITTAEYNELRESILEIKGEIKKIAEGN